MIKEYSFKIQGIIQSGNQELAEQILINIANKHRYIKDFQILELKEVK